MEPLQFAYWLQGFAELQETPPTPEQWKSIKEHLATVFVKTTPPVKAPLISRWTDIQNEELKPLKAIC